VQAAIQFVIRRKVELFCHTLAQTDGAAELRGFESLSIVDDACYLCSDTTIDKLRKIVR